MKKITEGPAAVDRSAPAQRPQTTIQWRVTQPRYTMEDILLDETTRAQLLDVVSYFQNQELLFHRWGLAERFSSQSCLAVKRANQGQAVTVSKRIVSEQEVQQQLGREALEK